MNCVLLADRHHGLSEGVRGLLETSFDQVFMVAERSALMEGAERLAPTVIVVDLSLAGGDVPALLRGLRARAPAARVLVLSVHDEPAVVSAVLAAGADAFVLIRSIATDLLPAVDSILAGQRYVSPSLGNDAAIPHPQC
jgi:DNA-binding NarL/FixJ family response regulator